MSVTERAAVETVPSTTATGPEGVAGSQDPADQVDELLVEEISIDGMCGVY